MSAAIFYDVTTLWSTLITLQGLCHVGAKCVTIGTPKLCLPLEDIRALCVKYGDMNRLYQAWPGRLNYYRPQ